MSLVTVCVPVPGPALGNWPVSALKIQIHAIPNLILNPEFSTHVMGQSGIYSNLVKINSAIHQLGAILVYLKTVLSIMDRYKFCSLPTTFDTYTKYPPFYHLPRISDTTSELSHRVAMTSEDSPPETTAGLAGSITGEKTHPSTKLQPIKVPVIVFSRSFFDTCLSLFLASIVFKAAMLTANGILRAIQVAYYISNQCAAFILVHACVPTRNEELRPSYVEIYTYLLLFFLFSTIAACAVLSRKHVFHPTCGFLKNVFTRAMDLGDADARQSREKININVRHFQVNFHIKINDLTIELFVLLKPAINTGSMEEDKEEDKQDGAEEAKEANKLKEPTPPVPERPPSAAGSRDLSFSNNGAGRISNQNVGNVVNTTIIFSEFTRPLSVIGT